jgi:serine/threonine protein phosphatase 1
MTRRRTACPEEDRAFLDTLPLSHRAGDCLFVHAGIQPGVPLEDQDPADLMWIRDTFLFDTRDHGVLVVHGHTPVAAVEHHGNRLAIDTGAGWDGPVSAVAIEGARHGS